MYGANVHFLHLLCLQLGLQKERVISLILESRGFLVCYAYHV